jgi:hypothetical protein
MIERIIEIREPFALPPILEPLDPETARQLVLSPFKKKTAEFWHNVADGRCTFEFYDERRGWQECGQTSRHIHHIEPEGIALAQGKDSEHEVGMPLCENHHVRNLNDEEHSRDFSFHPDAGRAYKAYGEWKQQNKHLQEITGKKDRRMPRQSPFEDMVDEHHEKQMKGERYHSGTPEIDDYYTQKMRDKATKYLAEHPEEKKPDTSPNPRYDPKKKKHWWDNII